METLELPVLEESEEETTPQLEYPMDRAAFLLWRDASRPDGGPEEEQAAER